MAFIFILLGTLLAAGPQQSSESCQRAAEAYSRGDLTLAESLLKKCLSEHPQNIRPYLRLCALYQSQGRDEELYAIALEGIQRFPNEKRFYLTVGTQSGRQMDFDRAIEVFSKGLQRWPEDSRFRSNLLQAYLSRGMDHLDHGDNQTAEADLRKALELEEDNTEVLLNLGRALHNQQKSGEALEDFDRVLRIDPQTPLIQFHRGVALYALGQYDAAIAALSEEIVRGPDYPASYYFRGLSFMYKADWEKALADLNIAVTKMPGYMDALYEFGRCLVHLSQLEEAEAAFRKSLRLDPSDPRPLYSLGRLLLRSGKTDAAEDMFRRAADLHAKSRAVKPGEIRFQSIRKPSPQ